MWLPHPSWKMQWRSVASRTESSATARRSPAEGRTASDYELVGIAKRFVSEHKRATARATLRAELALLDRDRWHVETDVILGGVTIPFVILGPGGVFILIAAVRWVMPDLATLGRAADELGTILSTYPGSVHAAIYLPLVDRETRVWYDAAGARAVVVGRGRLLELLDGVHDRGYSPEDIAALHRSIAADASVQDA